MAAEDLIYSEALKLKEAGDLEAAVAKWFEGLDLNPDHAITHSALAVHLHRLGRKEEAVKHAKRVTEIEPHDAFSFTQLSVICQRCGLIPDAEDAMARAQMISGHKH